MLSAAAAFLVHMQQTCPGCTENASACIAQADPAHYQNQHAALTDRGLMHALYNDCNSQWHYTLDTMHVE